MNKNKISIKTIIIMVILLLVGVLGVLGINTAKTYLSGASGDTEPENVLAKPNEDGKSAIISWSTDKASMGIVEYGTTPASLLLRAPESDQSTDHALTLTPLKANTNYYFRIRVGEEVFDNNGIPYSFKTKGTTITPTAVPTIAVVPTIVVDATGCNKTTDYNHDGVANSLDYIICLRTTPSPTDTKCPSGVDYNRDGVVNSLDRLKCLQDNK